MQKVPKCYYDIFALYGQVNKQPSAISGKVQKWWNFYFNGQINKGPNALSGQVQNVGIRLSIGQVNKWPKYRIWSRGKSRQVLDQVSQLSQDRKLADLSKVSEKFWVKSRLVHQIFLHIPLLSGARCARVVTWRFFFQLLRLSMNGFFNNGENLSAFFKPYRFYEKPFSTTLSM